MRGMGEPRQTVTIDRLSVGYWTLSVMEEGGQGDGISGDLAASWLGFLDLKSGVPWGEATFACQVWDARPDEEQGWDDADEVPFQCGSTGQVRVLDGDLQPTGDPLDLGAHPRWRVRVLARNRSSASLSVGASQAWLLQFWPDPQAHDAISGPPRRIADATPADFELTDKWYFPEEKDVAQIIRWAPKGEPLPSVRQCATRLGVSPSSVRAGLLTVDLLVTQRTSSSPFPAGVPIGDDEPVAFVWPDGFGRKYDATATRE